MLSECRAQPGAQQKHMAAMRLWRGCTIAVALGSALSGCSSLPASVNPVEWWHGLQGGAIAEQRPPPPGANDPYPNLATVPERPQPTEPATRQRIADSLVADRSHAQYAAEATPLPDPSSQSASPALFGRGSVPPPRPPAPDSGTAAASLAAATAPPAPPTTPATEPATVASPAATPPSSRAATSGNAEPAGAGPVQAAPLAPPAGSATAEPPQRDTASLPPLPAAPPSPPNLRGVAVPAAAPSAPAAPPAAPAGPTPAPAQAAAQAEPVAVAFARGSAVLPGAASASLRQLAAKRGSASIAVIGYGEAASSDPDAQSAALTLGLNRAQAMATVLTASGVPASSVRLDAEAAGRGGTARLLN
jgi:outer membrane protein OmpA-like peptidoglycan-associated protein